MNRRRLMSLIPTVLGGGGPAYGDPVTVVLQPDGTAGLDTFIDVVNPTTNNGTSTNFYIGDPNAGGSGQARGLIKFDLSSIPAGSLIDDVTLSLYEAVADDTTGVGSWSGQCHRVLQNWVEAQSTWNIYSTGNNWGTAGCSGDGVDRVAAASASVTLDGTAAAAFIDWTSAGLIADVQGFLDGTYNNYGWLVQAPTAELGAGVAYNRFNSSDHGTASQRPKLSITYREPL